MIKINDEYHVASHDVSIELILLFHNCPVKGIPMNRWCATGAHLNDLAQFAFDDRDKVYCNNCELEVPKDVYTKAKLLGAALQ